MNLTENTLRAALRETAEEYPAPRMPALDLSPSLTRHAGRRWPSTRTVSWLSASAAAIGVAAVIAASIVLGGMPRPSRPAVAPAVLPPYYVVLQELPARGYGPIEGVTRDEAVVRSTVTGQRITTISMPGDATFGTVQGSADGRLFLLTALTPAGHQGHLLLATTAFYLLRVNPSASPGRRAVFTDLPVPAVPASQTLLGCALTPDGRKLAVVTELSSASASGINAQTTLRVYDLSTGSQRSWTLPLGDEGLYGPPAWVANDRTLAIQPGTGSNLMWLVDTEAPGSSLTDTVLKLNVAIGQLGVHTFPLLTEDGEHILERVYGLPAPVTEHTIYFSSGLYGLYVMNISTGAVAALRAGGEPYFTLLWANQDGSAVVVSPETNPRVPLASAVLWTARGSRTIPIPRGTFMIAW
jgi:hypothetical protein